MMAEQPTFDELIEQARTLPEAERVRELCALVCNAESQAFWRRGARGKSDGSIACAQAIRMSGDVEGLEATIRRIVSRFEDA